MRRLFDPSGLETPPANAETFAMPPRLAELLIRYPALLPCSADLSAACEALVGAFRSGNKLLLCGNGGSASDCDHIAGEMLKGFGRKRPLAPSEHERLGPSLASKLQGSLPTLSLPSFTGLVSAWANDCDPEYVYAQLVHGLGRPGDVLLALSTSGNARNVAHAVEVARASGLTVIGLTGESGGVLARRAHLAIRVPASETFKIQEYHLPVYHALCLAVEEAMFPVG